MCAVILHPCAILALARRVSADRHSLGKSSDVFISPNGGSPLLRLPSVAGREQITRLECHVRPHPHDCEDAIHAHSAAPNPT